MTAKDLRQVLRHQTISWADGPYVAGRYLAPFGDVLHHVQRTPKNKIIPFCRSPGIVNAP
jgi:hypothetical protein